MFLSDILADIRRIIYNVFIIHNSDYFQLNNKYFFGLEKNDNLIDNLYEPFINFLNKQLGGNQDSKTKAKERKKKNKDRRKKNKKTNKIISLFYLIIFQALYASLPSFFRNEKTLTFDELNSLKLNSLRNVIIDFDNYNIIYYQPFIFIEKNNYYISYIFSKGYIDSNNKIKIDFFSYPFGIHKDNNKILNDLTFITTYTISQEEILEILNDSIYNNKTIELSNNISSLQIEAKSFFNSNTENENNENENIENENIENVNIENILNGSINNMVYEIKSNNNNFKKIKNIHKNINKHYEHILKNINSQTKFIKILENNIIIGNEINNNDNINYNIHQLKKINYILLDNPDDHRNLILNIPFDKFNNYFFYIKYTNNYLINSKNNKKHIYLQNTTDLDNNNENKNMLNNKKNIDIFKQIDIDILRFKKNIYFIINKKYYCYNYKNIDLFYGEKVDTTINNNINKIETKINVILEYIYKIKEFSNSEKYIIKYIFITFITQTLRNEILLSYSIFDKNFYNTRSITNFYPVIDCDNLIGTIICDMTSLNINSTEIITCKDNNICKYLCAMIKFNSQELEPELFVFPYFNKAITYKYDINFDINCNDKYILMDKIIFINI